MGKHDKTLADIMSGKRDANIGFHDLCGLLEHLGLELERISGSHHVFVYEKTPDIIILQPDKRDHSKAKPYQVKQVRRFIEKHIEE